MNGDNLTSTVFDLTGRSPGFWDWGVGYMVGTPRTRGVVDLYGRGVCINRWLHLEKHTEQRR